MSEKPNKENKASPEADAKGRSGPYIGEGAEEKGKALEQKLLYYYDLLEMYVRTSQPDKDLLSDLVTRAKGPSRTMKKFAEDIGTTPSTLSRIVNKQTRGANADRLIAEIAAHADPESGVTFEMLMAAHGMTQKKRPMRPEREYELESKKIIINELYNRQYSMVDVENPEMQAAISRFRLDYSIRTNALHEGSALWGFEAAYIRDDKNSHGGMGLWSISSRLMRITSALYFDKNPYDRISVVISDKDAFELMKKRGAERLGGKILKDEFSVILIDMEQGCVVEEYIIPNEKENNRDVFFLIEQTEKKASEDDEDDMGGTYEQQSFLPWLF